jgi:hypothetical protein
MLEQWRVRIRDKRRESVDLDLVVQAIVAFGRQLWEEQRTTQPVTCTPSEPEITGGERDES